MDLPSKLVNSLLSNITDDVAKDVLFKSLKGFLTDKTIQGVYIPKERADQLLEKLKTPNNAWEVLHELQLDSSNMVWSAVQDNALIRAIPGDLSEGEAAQWLFERGVPFTRIPSIVKAHTSITNQEKKLHDVNTAIADHMQESLLKTVEATKDLLTNTLNETMQDTTKNTVPSAYASIVTNPKTTDATAVAIKHVLESPELADGISKMITNQQIKNSLENVASDAVEKAVENALPNIINNHIPTAIHIVATRTAPYVASLILVTAGTYVALSHKVITSHTSGKR